jgi:hypothetical protein
MVAANTRVHSGVHLTASGDIGASPHHVCFTPKADITERGWDVRFVPTADVNALSLRSLAALTAPKSRNPRISIWPPQTAETPDIGSSLANVEIVRSKVSRAAS